MKNNTYPVAVGIDVAKATLCVCVRYADDTEHAHTIRNTETDINQKLIPCIEKCTGTVVMESTGHYHILPALLLTEHGCDVRVVNPILAKQYTSGNVRKVKTDPADAQGLARMAAVADNLPPQFSLTKEKIQLRKKFALLSSMSHHLQAMRASITSATELQEIIHTEDSPGLVALRESYTNVKSAMEKLSRECVAEAQACTETKETMELLETIPGVSALCAALSLNWFSLTPETTTRSLVAYAGLDVSSRSSGTWRGTCKLTKRGNAFLRKRLFSAAWGAVMNNTNFRLYYDNLKTQDGRTHTEALVIISRKIVRIMYHVIKQKTAYDPALFTHKYVSTGGSV